MTNNKSLAVDYLKKYRQSVIPFIDKTLSVKYKETSNIGYLPKKSVEHVKKTLKKGKLIRGALVKLGYELGGGRAQKEIVQTSSFIEFFHQGLLIQDDFMDNDLVRRGEDSLHYHFSKTMKSEKFGIDMATLTGDVLFFLAWEILTSSDFDPKNIVKASRDFAIYSQRLGYGQMLDIDFSEYKNKEKIEKVYLYKTAEYSFSLPLLVGYYLSGNEYKKEIYDYGSNLGMAFQLQDDLIEIFTDDHGKDSLSDLVEGKRTLLLLEFESVATAYQRKQLVKLLSEALHEQSVVKIRELIKASGAYDLISKDIEKYLKKAQKSIEKMTSDKKMQEMLYSFSNFIAS